jgi:hypothetical protein
VFRLNSSVVHTVLISLINAHRAEDKIMLFKKDMEEAVKTGRSKVEIHPDYHTHPENHQKMMMKIGEDARKYGVFCKLFYGKKTVVNTLSTDDLYTILTLVFSLSDNIDVDELKKWEENDNTGVSYRYHSCLTY